MSKWYKTIEYMCECESCDYYGRKTINKIILQCNCTIDVYSIFCKHGVDPIHRLTSMNDSDLRNLTIILNDKEDRYEGISIEDSQEIKNLNL